VEGIGGDHLDPQLWKVEQMAGGSLSANPSANSVTEDGMSRYSLKLHLSNTRTKISLWLIVVVSFL